MWATSGLAGRFRRARARGRTSRETNACSLGTFRATTTTTIAAPSMPLGISTGISRTSKQNSLTTYSASTSRLVKILVTVALLQTHVRIPVLHASTEPTARKGFSNGVPTDRLPARAGGYAHHLAHSAPHRPPHHHHRHHHHRLAAITTIWFRLLVGAVAPHWFNGLLGTSTPVTPYPAARR